MDPARAKKAAEKLGGVSPLAVEAFAFLREQGSDVSSRLPEMFLMVESKTKDARIDRLIDILALMAEQNPSESKRPLQRLIGEQLRTSPSTALLWAAWSADLRELDAEIQSLASGKTTDQKAIVRTARMIAGLWHESDSFTRCRMLTALALLQPDEFWNNEAPGKTLRMKSALDEAIAELPDRPKFLRFLERLEKNRKLQPLRSESGEAILTYLRQVSAP